MGYVGALMANGDFGDVDARLTDAERWLEPRDGTNGPTDEPVVRDELQFRRMPTAVAMYRAAEAQMHGDRKRTETFARRALELAGDDDPLGRGAAAGFLALSHWGSGELAAAHDEWADAQASLERAGHTVDAISCYRPLAEIRAAQGRLDEAMRTYEDGLRVAAPVGGTILRGAADLHVGMSELCLEWNKIDEANDHLRASDELGEGAGLPQNPYRWRVAMAQLRLATGDPDEALALLDDAERVFVSEYYPLLRPIPAQRARIHATQGRLREAEGWARDRGPGLIDGQTYLTEYEHITLARLGIAQGSRTHDIRARQEALELLDRLLAAADAGGRERSVIEILVLKAVAEHQGGRGAAGLEPLGRALTLAEPEGYVADLRGRGPADGRLAGGGGQAPGRLRVRRPPATCHGAERPGNRRQRAPRRAAQRTGTRSPASARDRPRRSRHRRRASRRPEHRAQPHQAHLREARREQPTGRRPARG